MRGLGAEARNVGLACPPYRAWTSSRCRWLGVGVSSLPRSGPGLVLSLPVCHVRTCHGVLPHLLLGHLSSPALLEAGRALGCHRQRDSWGCGPELGAPAGGRRLRHGVDSGRVC